MLVVLEFTHEFSLVSAEDMDSALALAKDCPVMRAGGGVEVGPVMEAAGS